LLVSYPPERKNIKTINLQAACLKILLKDKVILTNDHFVYASGRHGDTYVNKDSLYLHPKDVSNFCRLIAKHFRHKKIDVVVAPAIGGIPLCQWVAYHLSQMKGKEILAAYVEKEKGQFRFKRGYEEKIKGHSVLIVDDVITKGGTIRKVIKSVKAAGGKICGLAIIWNRENMTSKKIGSPPEIFSLIKLSLPSWKAKECPLCKSKIPINTNVGRGKEYLAKKK